jgi:acylphosphatase
MMAKRIVRLIIAGRVQGVGYRDFVRSEAEARAMRGWVRNRRDGTVEAVVSGDDVEDLIAACWRGPPGARVADIKVEPLAEADLPPTGFAIHPTA